MLVKQDVQETHILRRLVVMRPSSKTISTRRSCLSNASWRRWQPLARLAFLTRAECWSEPLFLTRRSSNRRFVVTELSLSLLTVPVCWNLSSSLIKVKIHFVCAVKSFLLLFRYYYFFSSLSRGLAVQWLGSCHQYREDPVSWVHILSRARHFFSALNICLQSRLLSC